MIKINLKEWEFEFQQRGEHPILLADLYCRGISKHLPKAFGIPLQRYDYLFTSSSKGYVNSGQKQYLVRKIRNRIEDRRYLAWLLERSIEVMNFGKLTFDIARAVRNPQVSNSHLATLWERVDEKFITLVPWFWAPWIISEQNMITDEVKRGLEKHREKVEKITDINKALFLVTFPVKQAAFQKEQGDFYELVGYAEKTKDFEQEKEFKKMARAYLRKYDWMTTFLLMPIMPMDYEELSRRVNKAIKEKSSEEFKLQIESKKINLQKTKEIKKIIKNDTKLLRDIKFSQELGYVLTASIEESFRSTAKCLPLLELISERLQIPFPDIKFFLSREIIDGLNSVLMPSVKEISRRKVGYVMSVQNGKISMEFGMEGFSLAKRNDAELNKFDDDIKVFNGQPASSGNVKGRVRVALQPSESHSLKNDEILVCPMTNPDYVSAMKRSAAIVTDEGGMLSHAAIMSREFNKPCIVGTKIATKILKNGQVVEVDANKGIVKILDKK